MNQTPDGENKPVNAGADTEKECQADCKKKLAEIKRAQADTSGHERTSEEIFESIVSALLRPDAKLLYKGLVQRAKDADAGQCLLSAKEMAALVKVDERTVRRWAAKKVLRKRKLGPRITRYDIHELLSAAEERRENPQGNLPAEPNGNK